MSTYSASMPPHAPYADAVVGEEVVVRAFASEEQSDVLTCEVVYREDTFGGQADLSGMESLARMTAVDQLITGVCSLVWNELLGTPTFHEDDEEWWTRVENSKPWEQMRRVPTQGWVDVDAVADKLAAGDAAEAQSRREAERAGLPAEERDLPERDHVAAALGDADVSDLQLSQEEMAALMRGQIPPTLTEKLLRARSTENLISSALEACEQRAPDDPEMLRVAAELTEVHRRFKLNASDRT